MFTKRGIVVGVLVVVAALAAQYYVGYTQEKKISSYYAIIDSQEKTQDDVIITDSDTKEIDRCRTENPTQSTKANECMRAFYDQYAMQHGIEMAFEHLARLQKERPDLLQSCHYVSHGIGHAALRLYDDNPYKAFTVMQSRSFYKNVATCGNGFFHGVIEEVAKGVITKDELVKKLGAICANDSITEKGGCFHGIGHAAMIQTEYNVGDALAICDGVSVRDNDAFACYSGSFMEYAQVFTDGVTITDKKVNFTLCDSLDEKYQPACYLEQSSFFDVYAKEKGNYTKNIVFCKQIENDVNRMACIKLFAIRSVRLEHYHDIYDMCLNTETGYERVMCTAVIAEKIASSVDDTRATEEYRNVVGGVCGTLNPLYARYCNDLVFRRGQQLFFTSEADLHFPPVARVLGVATAEEWLRGIVGAL